MRSEAGTGEIIVLSLDEGGRGMMHLLMLLLGMMSMTIIAAAGIRLLGLGM
jgi:hypothetical protein